MKRTELKRTTPIRKKAVRPRRKPTVTCAVRGCKRRPAVLELCKTHATREADRLFSLAVRSVGGRCARCGSREDLQCSHSIAGRRYLATRWDFDNCEALCRGCHRFAHMWPLEFSEELLKRKGYALWVVVRGRAVNNPRPDLADVLASLRGAL